MKRGIIVAIAIVLVCIIIVTMYLLTRKTDKPVTPPYTPATAPALPPAPVSSPPTPAYTPKTPAPTQTPAPAPAPVITTPPINLPAELPPETKAVLTAASFPMISDKIVRAPSGKYYYISDSMSGVKYPVNDVARSFYTSGFGNAIVDISAQHDAFLKLDTSRGTVVSWPVMFQ